MHPINSLARVMGNANRFTINCQGESAPDGVGKEAYSLQSTVYSRQSTVGKR